jgi:hypothetical protein
MSLPSTGLYSVGTPADRPLESESIEVINIRQTGKTR